MAQELGAGDQVKWTGAIEARPLEEQWAAQVDLKRLQEQWDGGGERIEEEGEEELEFIKFEKHSRRAHRANSRR